jgi:hypothetical protein
MFSKAFTQEIRDFCCYLRSILEYIYLSLKISVPRAWTKKALIAIGVLLLRQPNLIMLYEIQVKIYSDENIAYLGIDR